MEKRNDGTDRPDAGRGASEQASTGQTPLERTLSAQDGGSLPLLVQLMQRLLAPDGCPWDREQTLQSLRPYVIEEAYEVVEAIEQGTPQALREELGDLLLQVIFQSELARKQGWFGPDDVISAIHDKMVFRHPHVFGAERDATTSTSQVLENWEKLKAQEKAGRGVLDGVPAGLPALVRALRVSEKAARIGFEWPSTAAVRAKVDEELRELDAAVHQGDADAMHDELGDVLFALVNYARKLGRDPEFALRDTLDRFTRRVQTVEELARAQGDSPHDLPADALDALWQQAKQRDNKPGEA